MSEARYSYQTVADYLNLIKSCVQSRAKNLGFKRPLGLSVEDAEAIRDYKPKRCGRCGHKTTLNDLKKEMESRK